MGPINIPGQMTGSSEHYVLSLYDMQRCRYEYVLYIA